MTSLAQPNGADAAIPELAFRPETAIKAMAKATESYYVWITTRRIKPGTYEEFARAWRPETFPEGMLRAYECYAEDRNEVVGISIWDSLESRERYRVSEVEAKRRQAMAPYVVDESSGIYVGRELKIPHE